VPPKPQVVRALTPEGEAVDIGPVFGDASGEKLAAEVEEFGWTVGGSARHISAGSFRAMVKKEKNGD
jgi:hypothetical protein